MDKWMTFSYVLQTEGTNATREDFMLPDTVLEFEMILDSIAFENLSNATTSARLIIKRGTRESFHRQWTTLTANTLYYENNMNLPVGVGEIPGIALYGITADDDLKLYARGRWRRVD